VAVRRSLGLSAVCTLAAACSLTSLDGYFDCPAGHKDCKNPGSSGTGGGTEAGAGTASAGLGANGGGAGEVMAGGGLGGEAGSPPELCTTTQDCTTGTCLRGVCGPAFEVSYQDTPDSGTDPTQAKWIKFQFQIKNRTAQSYPLSSLTLRYYYTPDLAVSQFQALTASAPPGDVKKVTGSFGMTSGWTYLEVGFTSDAGTLNGGGASTGIIKVGIHDQNFADLVFYEPDDYSYLNVAHITLYLDSMLVAGIEPVAPPLQ